MYLDCLLTIELFAIIKIILAILRKGNFEVSGKTTKQDK